jgi:hypothetical protein
VKRQRSVEDKAEPGLVVIINRPFVSPQKKCDRCAEPSGMITPEEAAALCDVSTREIYRWLEMGAVHFSEGPGGGLDICLASLALAAGEKPKALTEGRQNLRPAGEE